MHLWYVAALTITLYQSDPACHYLVVCNVVRIPRTISQSEAETTTLYIAQPFTTTHSTHHQAFKPIEPWNNIVHIAIDFYTGFILSRTHDKHQWLLLQFIILLMMDANCVRNM